MTNTQNPSPDWGDATEWQQPGSGQPSSGGYQQAPGSASPQYGVGYQQAAPLYPQAPWQRPAAPPIQTYLVPAILVTLFCFFPTGIAAIVYATQVSSKRDAGDYIGAVRASKQARMWTLVSLAIAVAILVIAVIAAAASGGGSSSSG
jgi:hypothetical protein